MPKRYFSSTSETSQRYTRLVPQYCNQSQHHFFCRFASDWAREIAPDARAIHTI
jgi:hypothetical protein